jgi:mannan endo-1,4-beta-mannosidase
MLTRRSIIAAGAALASAGSVGLARPNPFVSVQGKQFILGGRPYRYAGTNLWYGAYLGSAGALGNRDRLKRELDTLHGLGLDNLRVLGSGEVSPLKNSLQPAFRGPKPPYNEELLIGLDYLLAEMAEREMKAVIYLNNFWEWSGGMVTYQYWTNGGHYMDLNDPAHPWPQFADFSAQFYASPKAIALYHDYVAAIVGRTNSVTGKAYRDDPAIMSWQLANEPRPGGTASKAPFKAFYAWIARTADFIKQRDANHLVSTGNEGLKGCLELEQCVIKAHQPKGIDYLTFHLWPLNWSWVDANDLAGTFKSCEAQSRAYIAAHLKMAETLGKPAVLEEFGFVRDGGLYAPSVPTTWRDRFYAMVFGMVEGSARKHGSFAGTNFWAWGGEGRAKHPDFMMRTGDTSYVGDPPQEPQGRNSVFDSDASTLAIIRGHVAALRKIAA